MKPVGSRSQLGLVLTCFLGLLFAEVPAGNLAWSYGGLLVAVLGVIGTFKASGSRIYFLATAIAVMGCAACIGFLATQRAGAFFWFLPVGLCMTLPVASVYLTPVRFVGIAALIWATLILIMKPDFATAIDRNLALLAVLSATTIGALGNRAIRRLRQSNFEMHQELHMLAYFDALTCLPNRRSFMAELLTQMETAKPERGLYFLMLDIDDFKKINDSFGHDVGDVALVEIAKVIQTRAAGHNFARLGGEEFAVAVSSLNEEGVRALASHLVEQASTCRVEGRGITLSVGISCYVADEGATSLMRRADEALYDAKRAGKNCYVMASSGEPAGQR